MRAPGFNRETGTSLVEVAVALVIVMAMLAFMAQSSVTMSETNRIGTGKSELQSSAHRAMSAIRSALKRSTFKSVTGKSFPYVFDDGVAVVPFASHAHTPAASAAVASDPDFGPNREIVFILPADADSDDRPDILNNEVVWSTDEVSFTIETYPGGNYLVRRVNGGAPERLANHVERIVFDTPENSGFTIPLGTVRVRLCLRLRDSRGTLHQYESETVIRLQSSMTG